jgi:hypothetical protein
VLEQLDGSMTLTGEYRDVRRFLHALDTAPEFVVIKSVSLAQDERDKALRITLQLGTWYRAQP